MLFSCSTGLVQGLTVHIASDAFPAGKDIEVSLLCPKPTSVEVAIDDYQAGTVLKIATRLRTTDGLSSNGPATSVALEASCTSLTLSLDGFSSWPNSDAAAEDIDQMGAAVGCDRQQPFGPAMFIAGVPPNAGGVRLSRDELTAYFHVNNAGQVDLYTSHRDRIDDPFDPATPLPGLNSAFLEASVTLPENALAVYFESNRDGANLIYAATRISTADTFSPPSILPLDERGGSGGPFVTPDGGVLYYHRGGIAGSLDIYRRDLRAEPSTPSVPVNSVNSIGSEDDPVVTPDELTIVFGSTRFGDSAAQNNTDMWIATRNSTTVDFDAPLPIGELNTSYDEGPTWISPDGCQLYFDQVSATSQRAYMAVRPPALFRRTGP